MKNMVGAGWFVAMPLFSEAGPEHKGPAPPGSQRHVPVGFSYTGSAEDHSPRVFLLHQ